MEDRTSYCLKTTEMSALNDGYPKHKRKIYIVYVFFKFHQIYEIVGSVKKR